MGKMIALFEGVLLTRCFCLKGLKLGVAGALDGEVNYAT